MNDVDESGQRESQDYETRLIGISNSLDILFIEVYAYVLDMLRDYFKQFKRSEAFNELAFEIKKKEKLYELLVESDLITVQ
jgi:hypothetical protein